MDQITHMQLFMFGFSFDDFLNQINLKYIYHETQKMEIWI